MLDNIHELFTIILCNNFEIIPQSYFRQMLMKAKII